LEVAVEAARTAGTLLLERFSSGEQHGVASKSTPTDLVSEADLDAERTIREMLARERPQDGFLGEEGGEQPGSSALRWVVDPLDGTINFLFGIPIWCVSIAVTDSLGTLAGVVHDPLAGETFTAVRGGAPQRNGVAIRPSRERASSLAEALVATGFAYDSRVRAAQADTMVATIGAIRDIRRCGAAALDLAWTAAGRFDAFFERTVKPWDTAAGALLCECAGLEVHELPERPGLPAGILAAPPELAGQLLELVG
jgi:myo-inositol-1(or 4)-monophosphatase